MKIKLLLIPFAFFCIIQAAFTQNELVIEITPDNNAEENYWVLYDVSKAVIQERDSFSDLTTHRDTIMVPSGQCYYWTLYDTYGDGMVSGFTPGSYRIFFDGVLIVENTNPIFGDSVSLYNLGADCLPNDAALMEVSMFTYISKEPANIGATILNMGKTPITSLEIFYQVNDFNSQTAILDGLNIPVGEISEISYPKPHNFELAGDYKIIFNITKINGTEDSYESDNSVSKDIAVVDGIVRKNMIEMMTSSSDYCPYCPAVNEYVDNTLLQNPGTYSMAKYFPEWWGDTKYIPGNDHRAGLYSDWLSEGSLFINGYPIYYIVFPTNYMDSLGQVADVKLTISGYLQGDSIYATVTILPMKNVDETVFLRGVAVQHMCHDNQLRGGEFIHPTYGYLPSPEGLEISKLTQGEALTFSFAGSILDYPLEEGSLVDMMLNFYVQKKQDREILQSENIYLTYKEVKPLITYNIENKSVNVDTANLSLAINSNRSLFASEGTTIGNIKDHIVVKLGSLNGLSFPFNATLNGTHNQIIIKPKYEWYTDTKYYVIVKNLSTLDNISISNDTLEFTTFPYVDVTEEFENSIKVFPNPAVNSISITCDKGELIQIFSVDGKLIETIINANGTIVHYISTYPAGLYFVKTTIRNTYQLVKLIKQD